MPANHERQRAIGRIQLIDYLGRKLDSEKLTAG
eukprot:CAMPEP_0117522430 /NCGR_PEP_ID=MMETSP0784-20121206/34203_1 /TAXON_ID=39447 /ORGANISM="" /LENGTH=32 /DNA_ID= /DNA_START= /DNA_END= /DNA_ORIENTATION=